MEPVLIKKGRKHENKPTFHETGDIDIDIEILACLIIKATTENFVKFGSALIKAQFTKNLLQSVT